MILAQSSRELYPKMWFFEKNADQPTHGGPKSRKINFHLPPQIIYQNLRLIKLIHN